MVFATFNYNNKEYISLFKEGKIIYGYRAYIVLPYFSKEYTSTKQLIQFNFANTTSNGSEAFCYEIYATGRGIRKTK